MEFKKKVLVFCLCSFYFMELKNLSYNNLKGKFEENFIYRHM